MGSSQDFRAKTSLLRGGKRACAVSEVAWCSRCCAWRTRLGAGSSSSRTWRTFASFPGCGSRCSMGSRGFAIKWCVVEASHAGAPQCRLRWFALARRGPASLQLSASPLPDGRVPDFEMRSGLHFNGGRPRPASWLLPKEDWARVAARLNMLGNAVVPSQAALAAKLLSL